MSASLVLAAMAGCNGGSGAAGKYPLVTQTQPKYQAPVTTPSGAVIRRPVPPTVHAVSPSATCERMMATFHDGSSPAKRPIVVPPAPGLQAQAITTRTIRLDWSFRSLPSDCRPARVLLGIVANSDVNATPLTRAVDVTATSGSAELTYPDFLSPPDVAIASAFMANGYRSRTVSVLVRR
jgi:hypothetical protein